MVRAPPTGPNPSRSGRGPPPRITRGSNSASRLLPRWKFKTELVRPEGTGTWTFAPIPIDLAKQTGVKSRMRVKGLIEGVPFNGTLLPFGSGRHFIVVKKEMRERMRKGPGDTVRVEMDLDKSPVVVSLPKELTVALAGKPSAKAIFEEMAPSHRKAYAEWIDDAKGADTRSRRAEKALAMIAKGQKL